MKRRRRRLATEWVKVNYTGAGNGLKMLPFADIMNAQPNPQSHVSGLFPVLLGDEPAAAASLMEERKEYVIDRIVGRAHIESLQNTGPIGGGAAPLPLMVRHGFIVLNVNENGTPEDVTFDPFSAPNFGGTDNVFPEANWMWVDTMLMGRNTVYGSWNGTPGDVSAVGTSFPANNQWGAVDRTKIDTAVRRRVRQQQRLYYCLAMAPIDPISNDYHTLVPRVVSYLDVRVLINWTSTKGTAGYRR